jgi:hypothetical protein
MSLSISAMSNAPVSYWRLRCILGDELASQERTSISIEPVTGTDALIEYETTNVCISVVHLYAACRSLIDHL